MTAEASPEFDRVKSVLEQRGVKGWADFGLFVNRPDLFRPSELDERAAMPVLLAILPTLTDGKAVAATARHLRRPWAKPTAFVPLVEAFTSWAGSPHSDAGWALGDAVASVARPDDTGTLLSLASDRTYGTARQMIVYSLWRFRKDARVADVLEQLAEDSDVSLHAMSALRRTVGNDAALALLHRLSQASPDRRVNRNSTSSGPSSAGTTMHLVRCHMVYPYIADSRVRSDLVPAPAAGAGGTVMRATPSRRASP